METVLTILIVDGADVKHVNMADEDFVIFEDHDGYFWRMPDENKEALRGPFGSPKEAYQNRHDMG